MMAAHDISRAPRAGLSSLQQKARNIEANGWPIIPMGSKYGKGQKYPASMVSRDAERFGVRLDGAILLDYDGNKASPMPISELFELLMGEPITEQEALSEAVQWRFKGGDLDGSYHWLFRLPEGVDASSLRQCVTGVFEGVDIKTGNQLIFIKADKDLADDTLPPISELLEAPTALLELLKQTAPVRTEFAPFAPTGETTRYGAAALAGALEAVANAPQGHRNETLNTEGLKVAQLVAGGEIAAQDAAELEQAALAAGMGQSEITATLASATAAGMTMPRNAPPKKISPLKAIAPAYYEQSKPKASVTDLTVRTAEPDTVSAAPRDAGELAAILKGHPLADFAVSVAGAIQFPRDSAVLAGLTIASSAISDVYRTRYAPYAKPICTSLYSLIAQAPGSGKSSVFSQFLGVLDEERHNANIEIRRIASSYNEGRDKGDQHPFRLLAVSVKDCTSEALDSVLTRTDGHFFAASDEQSLVNSLIGGAYSQSGKPVNNGVILDAFCGAWANSIRVTREGFAGFIHGAVCCVTQAGVIETVATSSEGSGVAERFIMLDEPSLLGYRQCRSERPRVDESLCYAYEQAIAKLVAKARDRAKSISTKRHWQDMPEITPSREGYDLIADFMDYEIEKSLRPDGAYNSGILQGTASKSDQKIIKFAAVLHVFDCLMNGREVSPEIGDRWIKTGIEIVRWSLMGMKKAIEKSGVSGSSVELESVTEYVNRQGNRGVSASAAAQYLRKRSEFKHYGERATERVHAAIEAAIKSGDLVGVERFTGRKPVAMLFAAGYEPLISIKA